MQCKDKQCKEILPIEWKMEVPIFKNRLILKQLVLAVGLPFIIVFAALLVLAWKTNNFQDAKYAFGIIGLAFFLAVVLILVAYRDKYSVKFRIDRKGVYSLTQDKQAKTNRKMQGLLAFLGIINLNPTAVGIAVLAQTREKTYIPWRRIRSIRYYPKQHTIIIRGGWTESVALFCQKDSYARIKELLVENSSWLTKNSNTCQ
ncbi:hypothetical protein [Desulfuribacillus alkaliarsenatis]|uniref:Uncharacterized protein n=1 Tax=Desulfuribacillus alkaliarsenatis TaxID=766136 RepID=A0A1E5G2U2_9FIRM|nr:hypothetical protein [Desulfuribacillus alkaliarsenatis]OEF97378.1 hypothetical protein BHF68_03995 [Desulfuribacillus alkaliarsenatis]